MSSHIRKAFAWSGSLNRKVRQRRFSAITWGGVTVLAVAGFMAANTSRPADHPANLSASQLSPSASNNPVVGKAATPAASEQPPAAPAVLPPTGSTQRSPTMSSSNQSQSSTQVNINGQNIPVPSNGTVHRTIQDANGQTNVDISVSNSSSGTESSQHTGVNVESYSSSSVSTSSSGNSSSQEVSP